MTEFEQLQSLFINNVNSTIRSDVISGSTHQSVLMDAMKSGNRIPSPFLYSWALIFMRMSLSSIT